MPNRNNFDALQQLWQQETGKQVLPAADIAQQIKKQQWGERLKMVGGTALLAATFFFILFIAFHYHFVMVTTQIGIVLILLSIAAAVFLNSKMIALLFRGSMKADADNKTMLRMMETFQQKQHFFQTTFMSVYYVVLAVGLMLYMYELTHTDIIFMLMAYGLSLGWIAFAWWYLRPRMIKKQQERIDGIIGRIKSLENEMNDEDESMI